MTVENWIAIADQINKFATPMITGWVLLWLKSRYDQAQTQKPEEKTKRDPATLAARRDKLRASAIRIHRLALAVVVGGLIYFALTPESEPVKWEQVERALHGLAFAFLGLILMVLNAAVSVVERINLKTEAMWEGFDRFAFKVYAEMDRRSLSRKPPIEPSEG